MAIRVVVVDGHTLTRFGLTTLAAAYSDLEIVAEAKTAAEAPDIIAATSPNVVTVAVGLPDADGLKLARDLRDRYPTLGIVVLTAQGEDDGGDQRQGAQTGQSRNLLRPYDRPAKRAA